MILNLHKELGLEVEKQGEDRVFVKGTYEYHHYCQQGLNDRGWGCAYRSCQTLLSWLAHRCPPPIPSIPTIPSLQQMLISAGDKPQSFLGSTTWIGSIEISILVSLLFPGAECRIVHMPSAPGTASDIKQVCDQLFAHLSTVGSPVMVGGETGGARAIIAASRTPSGKYELLSLDPHYSGPDTDVASLSSASPAPLEWVAPSRLFATYGRYVNLCMPLPVPGEGVWAGEGQGGGGNVNLGGVGGGAGEWDGMFEVVEAG